MAMLLPHDTVSCVMQVGVDVPGATIMTGPLVLCR